LAHVSIRIESILLAKLAPPATYGDPSERFGRVGWDFLGFLREQGLPNNATKSPKDAPRASQEALLGPPAGPLGPPGHLRTAQKKGENDLYHFPLNFGPSCAVLGPSSTDLGRLKPSLGAALTCSHVCTEQEVFPRTDGFNARTKWLAYLLACFLLTCLCACQLACMLVSLHPCKLACLHV